MKEIDVFVDLENIVNLSVENVSFAIDVELFITGLLKGLHDHGYSSARVHVFARYWPRRKSFTSLVQKEVTRIVTSAGCIVKWSKGIADAALIDYVQGLRERKELSHEVMIVSDDRDFAPLVEELCFQNYHVSVLGERPDSLLKARAKASFLLSDFIGFTMNRSYYDRIPD